MASSILDQVGLGNRRAVANAEAELLRRLQEDRIVADLVVALELHDQRRAPSGAGRVGDDLADVVGPAA